MLPATRRLLTTAVATATLLAAAGCGRQDDSPTPLLDLPTTPSPRTGPPSTSPTTGDGDTAAAPTTAYRAWLSALADRDAAAACARQAPQLTIDLRFEAILLERARLGDPCVDFVAVLWEQPEREYDVLGVEATQVTDEDALLAVDLPGTDQTVRMVRQDTRWLVATSEPRAEGGDPQRWLDVWCDLDLEMTTVELIAAMGEPSGTYTIADGGEPQLYWAQNPYDFRAYLDADPPAGRTIDLVGDYDRLRADERAGLTCPELR